MLYLTEWLNMDERVLDQIFSSLSDPTRREILQRIADQSLSVTDIAKPYHMSLPAVSKHLKVLERAHLVIREKAGREYRFRLCPDPLKEASRYLSFYRQYWNTKLDTLEKYLSNKSFEKGGETE